MVSAATEDITGLKGDVVVKVVMVGVGLKVVIEGGAVIGGVVRIAE